MNRTYPMTELPLPDGVVIIRGNWYQRDDLEGGFLPWLKAKAALPNLTYSWSHAYLDEILPIACATIARAKGE